MKHLLIFVVSLLYIHSVSASVCVMNCNTNEVIYEEDMYKTQSVASISKLMTAIIVIENVSLSEMIYIENDVVNIEGSSIYLKEGEIYSVRALLYGLMLPSGNDSAVAIAEYISGSEKEFAVLMNEEARKLGATNSNFVNAHGYHDDNHYTTAYDLYLILKECVKNDTFLEIVSSKEYTLKIDQKNGTYRNVTWRQTNQFVTGLRSEPNGIDVIGGKTGTTDQAGSCLIMYSETDAHPYISVVMGANNKAKLYENMTYLISGAVKSEN